MEKKSCEPKRNKMRADNNDDASKKMKAYTGLCERTYPATMEYYMNAVKREEEKGVENLGG